jgi:CheY-like chemotaxis protein
MLVFTGGLSTQLRVLSSSTRGVARPKQLTLENWELNVLSQALETSGIPLQPGTRRMASAYGDEPWPAVSHDIRIQLTGIMGFSELLLDGDFGPLSAGQKECLDDILSSAKALLDIVEQGDLVSFESQPEGIAAPALVLAARENSPAGLLIVPGKARSGNSTESLLKSAGYSVQTAATESEVRLRCENQLFDVIVFDLEPSNAGSVQILRVIRESGLNARAPVIGLSIAGSAGDAGNDRTGRSAERLQQIAGCLRRLTSKPPLSSTATALGGATHGS